MLQLQHAELDQLSELMTREYLFSRLSELMTREYLAVSYYKNPVAQIMQQASRSQLTYIMQQYCFLPKEIVAFAQVAQQKAFESGWYEVAQELQQTIVDELGSETQGISHYDLLADGIEAGGVPVKDVNPSPATAQFMSSMQSAFDQKNEVSRILGAAYALEATAVPELHIISQLTQSVFGGTLPKTLQYFFTSHINQWEPKHEESLRASIGTYPVDAKAFEVGFRAVLSAMDTWWSQLREEAGLFHSK